MHENEPGYSGSECTFTPETLFTHVITEYEVQLTAEYTDTQLIADVDDLLENHDTGAGNGINGLADNTVAWIHWNESNVNTVLGDPATGACAIHPTTLAAYTGLPAAEVVVNVYSAAGFGGTYGIWWQHSGGSHSNGENFPADPGYSIFDCTFSADTSMHTLVGTNADWSSMGKHHFRFNVPAPVCGAFATTDNTPTTGSICVASIGGAGARIVIEPNPVAISSVNTQRVNGRAFTSPGYLTAGDCPCSGAP